MRGSNLLLSCLLIAGLPAGACRAAQTADGAGGVEIHYDRYGGSSATIVFVHGWSCDRRYWANQVEFFADDYQVLAIDLAGHGESGADRDDWSMRAFGHDVAAVIDAESLDEVILVGHSMGGPVVLEAAQLLGSRVKLVVAVDTLQLPTQPRMQEAASRSLWQPFAADYAATVDRFVRENFFLPTSPQELVDRVASDMASAEPAIALEAGHALTTWDVPAGIRNTASVPLVLINADYRPTDEAGLRSLHPDARVVVMEGVGHFPMLERPDTFNDILADIIEAVLPP